MATEETKCSDNYFLPKGSDGARGPIGITGSTGLSGKSTVGPAGPAGGNKIDINFQVGNKPYIQATSAGEFKTLAHFIFPGTQEFTPQSWKVAIGYTALRALNKVILRLGYLTADGEKVIVSTIEKNLTEPSLRGLKYLILTSSALSGLPLDASNFFVEASVSYMDMESVTRFYATELR